MRLFLPGVNYTMYLSTRFALDCIFLIRIVFVRNQICLSEKFSDEKINEGIKHIRDNIYGASEQFMDDVKAIANKQQNDTNDLIAGVFGGLVRVFF